MKITSKNRAMNPIIDIDSSLYQLRNRCKGVRFYYKRLGMQEWVKILKSF